MASAPLRFQVSKPVLLGREKEYVLDALESGWISSAGKYIGLFEGAVSAFLGAAEGIAVSNGTVALHVACLGMGLKPGMDVVVPSLTYVAAANAVAYCGARPVLADSDPRTWNLTVESVKEAWTPATVGVLAVHLYGLPAPIAPLAALCRERGAWLIEDCAEAFGARHDGICVGRFGDAAAFSFFGNKIISTGEGGMVFVRDEARRRLVRMIRGQGMQPDRRYWHPMLGYNYRLTNVAAAIGLGQMEMASHHIAERRRVAARYLEALAPLEKAGLVRLPVQPEGSYSVYWLFSIVLEGGGRPARDRIQERLLGEHGIETRPFFVPMHRLPMYEGRWEVPHAEFLGEHGLNLPTYSGLLGDDVDEISAAVSRVVTEERRR
jgi:perosamine synthetase